MKNFVLVFCAMVALFSVSACKKCIKCVSKATECANCVVLGVTTNTYCNDEAGYNGYKNTCTNQGGSWNITTTLSKPDVELCDDDASDKAAGYELVGYDCN